MNSLRLVLDICLLRGRAQDLPAAASLVWLMAGASVAVDYLGLLPFKPSFAHLLFIVVQTALFGGLIWLVLLIRGLPARWLQTQTALFGADAVLGLLRLPVLYTLSDLVKLEPAALMASWQGWYALGLMLWFLAVLARVLREATEWTLVASTLAGITVLLVMWEVGILITPWFGLTPA